MIKGDRARAVRRFVLASVAGPLLLGAIAVVTQLLALPDVPEQVAVHWGANGPDQMGPSWLFPVLTSSLSVGFIALISLPIAVSFARSENGEPPTNLRFVTATLWAVTGFFAVCLTAALYLQRGLGPSDPITGMGDWAGIAAGFGVLAAVAGFFAAPERMLNGKSESSTHVERLDISPGERLVWSRTVALKAGPRFALWGIAIASTAVATYLVATMPAAWWVWAIVVAAIFAIVTALALQRIRVIVNARGVQVRSGIGTTLKSVDTAVITDVTTGMPPARVGRGVRLLDDGARAIVMNPGPVLRVHTQRPSNDLMVSIPNPDEAVTVLRTLVPAPT